MSGPRNAETRLRRLLVMLPWLMEAGEVPLADVAARFDMTPAQVTKDLELVAMCGLPPYVDEMIDVFVDDGMVVVGVPRLFQRSLALTAPEGFSLLASARTAMELPGADPTGPLARGLAKLAAALGAAGIDTAGSGDDTAGVAIDLARPALTDEITEAVAAGAELSVDYYSPASDEVTARVMVPRHVFVDGGNWYVRADDARSGELRTFRIDRFERVDRTGAIHPLPDEPVGPSSFFTDRDLPRVTVQLAPTAQWIIDRYPVDSVADVVDEETDGEVATVPTNDADVTTSWIEVTLPVSSDRWLSRLLVRLGPDARLVGPYTSSAKDLAERMLARYDVR